MSIPRWETISVLGSDAITAEEISAAHPLRTRDMFEANERDSARLLPSLSMLKANMAVEFKGDRDYGAAGHLDDPLGDLPESFCTAEYAAIADVFSSSISRVVAMHALPIDLAFFSHRQTLLTSQAIVSLGMDLGDKQTYLQRAEEIDALTDRLSQEDRESRSSDEAQRVAHVYGGSVIKGLNQRQIENNHDVTKLVVGGVDAIYSAMVSISYGAFEVLAGDLWYAALNRFPALAASWANHTDNVKKNITLAELAGEKFNLSSGMGDFLRRKRSATFSSLNDVANHYTAAFGSIPVDLRKGAICATAQVRHLFAHRAGIVDQKFKDETAAFPRYADLPVGSQLTFHGAEVLGHVRTCVETANALAIFVDKWTQDHAEKR